MSKYLIVSIKMFFVLTLLTGVIYPLAVTGISQIIFNHQANGNLILKEGKVVGSQLIGQYFDDPKYFWGRPSATLPAYNASMSLGSNLGPTNKALVEAVKLRVDSLKAVDPGNNKPIPADLVTTSGSGLDPHITVEATRYQIPRIARVRGLPEENLAHLVQVSTEHRQWGIFGQPRINVLRLNLMLDNNSMQEK